jgi:putative spermidine/putrescine transport system permease protein
MTLRRRLPLIVGLALAAPLLLLPIQAIGDEWRAPALWPQQIGGRGFRRVFEDALLPTAIFNSVLIGIVAVALGMAVAWPAARSFANQAVSRWALIAIVSPLLLPPLVVGEGLQVSFLRLGLTDTIVGVALAHLVYVIPYMVLILRPAFTTSLIEQEQAASGLGASGWWRMRMVTLPGVAPSLLLAAAMGFTVSWSQYGTSLGVGGGIPTLPIVLVPFVGSDPQVAAVLDLIFLVPPLIALTIALRSEQRI